MFTLQVFIDLVKGYNIHLLNGLFIGFTLTVVILGSLFAFFEEKLPHAIRKIARYGKHEHKGPTNAFVLEVPKKLFKHFYVTALILSTLTLLLAMRSVAYGIQAPEFVLQILDLATAGPAARKVQVDSSLMLMASLMLFTQCARRFYETHFVQIFSSQGKMNLSHYFVGHLHYIGVTLAVIAYGAGFVRGTKPSIFDTQFSWLQYACIYIFYLSWVFQLKSNLILARLRTDARTGKVKTEKHLMPTGGLFEYVSSPHMLTEIIMYLCLWSLMPNNTTWLYVVTWVAGNQVMNAVLAHKWYKQTFKNYPKNRKAIIPFIL